MHEDSPVVFLFPDGLFAKICEVVINICRYLSFRGIEAQTTGGRSITGQMSFARDFSS